MLRYRGVKVKEIAKTVEMSAEHIHHILHVELRFLLGGCRVYWMQIINVKDREFTVD